MATCGVFFTILTLGAIGLGAPPDLPTQTPGGKFVFPDRPHVPGAPLIYEHSREAGPDETFFLVGENLTTDVIAGARRQVRTVRSGGRAVLFQTGNYLAATLPENPLTGVFLVWVKNAKGYSAPIVLNRPEPWWCRVEPTEPDEQPAPPHIDVYGRNLCVPISSGPLRTFASLGSRGSGLARQVLTARGAGTSRLSASSHTWKRAITSCDFTPARVASGVGASLLTSAFRR